MRVYSEAAQDHFAHTLGDTVCSELTKEMHAGGEHTRVLFKLTKHCIVCEGTPKGTEKKKPKKKTI